MPSLPRSFHAALLPCLGALLAAGAAQAQTVTVLPKGGEFTAGSAAHGGSSDAQRATFQFRAVQEGAEPQPLWDWSIVDLDGRTVLADAGSITAQGLYTPPAVALSKYRLIKIKATSQSDRSRSGQVLVTIRPHQGLAPLEKVLGTHWRGARIEFLAGGIPDTGTDSKLGPEARFQNPACVAYAGTIPCAGQAPLENQWLVADDHRVRLVGMDGAVRTWAVAPAFPTKPGEAEEQRPQFTRVAVKPWSRPEDGAWEAFLWDQNQFTLWRLDGEGRLAPHAGRPGHWLTAGDGPGEDARFLTTWALAVDRAGNCYAGGDTTLRRIAPDGTVTTVAPVNGQGQRVHFGVINALTVDPAGTRLLAMEQSRSLGAQSLRTLSLATGLLTGVKVAFDGPRPEAITNLAWHGDQLLCGLAGGDTAAGIQVLDPATGVARCLYRDAEGTPRFPEDLSQRPHGLRPGPLPGPGLAWDKCGALGSGFKGFAVGRDGQIAVLAKDTWVPGEDGGKTLTSWLPLRQAKLGLLLLDWEALATAPQGAPAAPQAGPREERKEVVETKQAPAGKGLKRPWDGNGPTSAAKRPRPGSGAGSMDTSDGEAPKS